MDENGTETNGCRKLEEQIKIHEFMYKVNDWFTLLTLFFKCS